MSTPAAIPTPSMEDGLPTAALDEDSADQVEAFLVARARLGTGILWVIHDAQRAAVEHVGMPECELALAQCAGPIERGAREIASHPGLFDVEAELRLLQLDEDLTGAHHLAPQSLDDA